MNNIIKLKLVKKTITYEKAFSDGTYDYTPPGLADLALGTVVSAIYCSKDRTTDSLLIYLEDKQRWIEISHEKHSKELIINLFAPA